MDGKTLHCQSLEIPEPTAKSGAADDTADLAHAGAVAELDSAKRPQDEFSGMKDDPAVEENSRATKDKTEPWPERSDVALEPYFSQEAISELKKMVLDGSEPPRVSNSDQMDLGTLPAVSEPAQLQAGTSGDGRRGGQNEKRRSARDHGKDARNVLSEVCHFPRHCLGCSYLM
jgi:hypothetical protein